jgi:hypothetical protein
MLFSAFSIWCIICLLRHRRNNLLRAWGWLALCVTPGVIIQNISWLSGTAGMKIDLRDVFITLPYSWYVLSCGQSVIKVFEENVKNWTGHRTFTMIDNWPVFFALGFLQAVILSYVVARRLRAGRSLKDPMVISAGVFMCVNAILASSWNWAGT